jgi:thioredoxin 1
MLPKTGLVKFGATWCGPCKAVKPALEAVKLETNVELLEVDIDEDQDLASQFGIRGVPTVLAFKDGNLVGQLVGAKTKEDYLELVNKLKGE